MANEQPIPLAPAPGVCFSAATYAVGKDNAYIGSGSSAFRTGTGRWANAYNIEFVAGFPQKIAGWAQAVATPLTDIPRAQRNWRDANGLPRTAVGTTSHLYYWQNGVATDITPLTVLSAGSLTNPFTTTIGTNTVAVADASQVLVNGDFVFLNAAAAVGGLTINGWYQVSARSGTGYTITLPITATSSAGPGGGTTAYQYPRINLTNPFTTTNGSATVTVSHTSHGRVAGSYVTFANATAVGGLTVTGEYQIASVIDPNTYTITAASAANAAATGGGTVSILYPIVVAQSGASGGAAWGAASAWGATGAWGSGGGQGIAAVLTDGWTLSAYGSQMLAAPIGGTIYVFDSAKGGRAYPLLNAPASVQAMFVTAERFVVALGINGNLMQLAWADQNDYTVWTTLPTNTANSGRTLIGGSYFVGGLSIRNGLSLIWTDKCLFTMNYTGGQSVYSTTIAGDNCGLVGPWAMCAEGNTAYWMSDQDWWSWSGTPQPLPSDDVRASVFQPQPSQAGINRSVLSKCIAALNRSKKQVRFYFPSAIASENDGGMIYHYDQTCFSPLAFGRCSAEDANLLAKPMSCDTSGLLYYDETGTDANGGSLPCYLELASMDISNGAEALDIFGFIPNFQTLIGTAIFNAQAAYYPSQTLVNDGPWPITANTDRQDLLLDGKLFAFSLSLSGIGSTMRLGVSRLDVQQAGARV